jgi:hypothetical protein
MKRVYNVVTPTPPCFLKVIDSKGVAGRVSSLESISFKLVDSKEVGGWGGSRETAGRLTFLAIQRITYSNRSAREI